GDALARVDDAEAAHDPAIRRALGLDLGDRPGRVRHHPDRALEAGREREVANRVRVDDEPRRVLEHEPGERELLWPRLPERREGLVLGGAPAAAPAPPA